MQTLLDIKEPATVTVFNVVAGTRQINARKVQVKLGGKHAQFDKHLFFVIDENEPKWLKKYGSVAHLVYLDGMVRYTITDSNDVELFDSADYFPVYPDLQAARFHRDAQQHLGMEYFRGHITQDQYYAAFRLLTEA